MCDVGYVPILVFIGLSFLDLGPMYATERQTNVRQMQLMSAAKVSVYVFVPRTFCVFNLTRKHADAKI